MKKLVTLGLISASFLLLTGFHGGCRSLTPEEKATRLERHTTAWVDDMMDDVDADLKQRAEAQAIRKRVVIITIPLIAEQEKAKQFFFEEWDAENPDREEIHKVVDEHVDAFRKVLHVAADGLIELHSILTPDQRKEMVEDWRE